MSRARGKNIRTMQYVVEMPDGSHWAVPVEVIARSRAQHYADEFDNDIERSLEEDTWPLFENSDYEVTDWAADNMNWDEVEGIAVKLPESSAHKKVDYQEGWINGEKSFI